MRANPALNLAPFGRWTLRDRAAQRRLALRYGTNSRKKSVKNLLLGSFKVLTSSIGSWAMCKDGSVAS